MKYIWMMITAMILLAGCNKETKQEQPKQQTSKQIKSGGASMHSDPIPEDDGDEMPGF